jgi:hypothetical protein
MKDTTNVKWIKKQKIGSGIHNSVFGCLTREIPEEPKPVVTKNEQKREEHRLRQLEKKANEKERVLVAHKKEFEVLKEKIANNTELSKTERKRVRKLRKQLRDWIDLPTEAGVVSEKKTKKKNIRKQRTYKRVPREYKVYINSEHWTRRKNLYFQSHRKWCVRCFSTLMVHLHHARYESKTFGKEPDDELFPLCENCHKGFHDKYGVKKDMLLETKCFIATNV